LTPQRALLFGLGVHTSPHLPQFWVSFSLTQAPLQGLKPSSHAMPQPLAPHVARPFATAAQAVSHVLQCPASVARSTHEPPQFVLPLGQSTTHLPLEHACPMAQGLSQPPQCVGLSLVSTQAEPHSAKPWLQLAPHTPASHTAMPLAGASQTLPHVLQFCASVVKLTQAEPHKAKPGAQVRPHFPSSHTALPLAGMGHAMPHWPQLRGLAVVSMHEPLQFMRPPEQPAVHFA
jgi:hypothetical protein